MRAVTSDLTGIAPVHSAQRALVPDACAAPLDLPALDATSGQRRRTHKRQETRAERRERLHRAAGEAIRCAAETEGDPVGQMVVATGLEARYCEPAIRDHPLFCELRARLLMPHERRRKERAEREAAAIAAEPGLVVWVRRQFNNRRRRAAYRMSDLSGLHWSSRSGGKQRRANRQYLHAYVWCDAKITGAVAHSCRHGPPPHRIKVCITKVDNKKTWRDIERAAPARATALAHGKQHQVSETRHVPALDPPAAGAALREG
jgi:hypothetical protein